jgi:hypothetical protein
MRSKAKIGIAGTHSTGKTSFLRELKARLDRRDIAATQLPSLAHSAQSRGFPILREHTYESTLWIIGATMQQEAEAGLAADVVLVDRPVIDALAYLIAALEVSSREISTEKLLSLRDIVTAHTKTYDMLIVTQLDPNVPLGDGRDSDPVYRAAVATHLLGLVPTVAPHARVAAFDRYETHIETACELISEVFALKECCIANSVRTDAVVLDPPDAAGVE